MTNVLIVSLGASPSVVTETLWALANRSPSFWPDELHLVTTAGSKDVAALAIPAPSPAAAAAPGPKVIELSRSLHRPIPRAFVHLPALRSERDVLVSDIRSIEEATAFGNCIAEVVRQATARPETQVHLSIAGGRKTMSYHAGAAMTLYGRAQDEVSHVLVRPAELEGCPDFWWPTETPAKVAHRFLKAPEGAPLMLSAHRDDVAVELIVTPFFRARRFLSDGALASPLDYADVVALANVSTGAPRLSIDLTKETARIGPIVIPLTASELALYAVFAVRAKAAEPAISVADLSNVDGVDRKRFERFRQTLKSYAPNRPLGRSETALAALLSRTRRAIEAALPQPELMERFGIVRDGRSHHSGYLIRAAPDDIDLVLGTAV